MAFNKANTGPLLVLGLVVDDPNSSYRGQISTLKRVFVESGMRVSSATSFFNPLLRLLALVFRVCIERPFLRTAVLDVYGGRSFIIEDLVSLVGKLLGFRFIFILRGGALPEFAHKYPNWHRRVMSRARMLVAPSTFLESQYRKLGFHCRVIPNVIRISDYPFVARSTARPTIIWMRTFHPVYDPLLAVRALAIIKKEIPSIKLKMAGKPSPYLDIVKAEVEKLNLSSNVEFLGFLDQEAKRRHFLESDIYLNTNLIDNMPVSVVEACAFGCAVVATSVGGIPHLVKNEETALIVPPENAEAVAKAVIRLIREPELVHRLSQNGRVLAEKSSESRVVESWRELLAEIH